MLGNVSKMLRSSCKLILPEKFVCPGRGVCLCVRKVALSFSLMTTSPKLSHLDLIRQER